VFCARGIDAQGNEQYVVFDVHAVDEHHPEIELRQIFLEQLGSGVTRLYV
jgi:hypothetical protein